ncbi:MAG: hypothetical protein KDA80_20895, partial [Planctomycetaceae bacterium]|nr:hypothetical protein [Planctomycetaceae bacterium]
MNHGKIPTPLSAMATIGSLLFLLSGCQSLPAFSHGFHKQRKTPEASVEHPVVECICLWEPGEGTGLDGLPCRGFAG